MIYLLYPNYLFYKYFALRMALSVPGYKSSDEAFDYRHFYGNLYLVGIFTNHMERLV